MSEIQRWDFEVSDGGLKEIKSVGVPGDYVLSADHFAEVQRLREQVRMLREALKQWQNKFHETACTAGEFHHGIPIRPRIYCDLCHETNEALEETKAVPGP